MTPPKIKLVLSILVYEQRSEAVNFPYNLPVYSQIEKMKKYQPVSCDFVDQIEIAALQHKSGLIRFLENGQEVEVEDSVKTWETRNGEEFLITGSGRSFRLDHILWLIDKPGAGTTC